jgi:short-subunit dehydrogenase
MTVRLKPVEEQVIVIVGASSGIGLATARAAADRGAKLVLVARNGEALDEVVKECAAKGTKAVAVAADAANRDDLLRVEEEATRTFGGFDTWINNAAVALYGTLEDIPLEDQRRLFDVNYWGMVYGSLIAARTLKSRGGAIINTGSVLSERTMILQTPYSASKHAVKGFTDGLRMELEREGAPVSVTLIKPSAIDTPYPEHARLYTEKPGATLPPPAYDPMVVAKAMLFAAENPKRELTVGFGGWAIAALGTVAPRTTDLLMEAAGYATQTTDNPGRRERRDNLYQPREDGAERSSLPGGSRKTSLFLEAQMHPVATALALAGFGLVLAQLVRPKGPAPRHSAVPARRYEGLTRRVGNGEHREAVGPGRYPRGETPCPVRPRPAQPRH